MICFDITCKKSSVSIINTNVMLEQRFLCSFFYFSDKTNEKANVLYGMGALRAQEIRERRL